MNKKEIKAKVTELLLSGVTKMEVFTQLSGQGIKDSQLAYFIASHADPGLCTEHDRKVNIIIGLMSIQAALAFLLCLAIGAKIGPNAKWIIASLAALIPLLFAWGFYKHRVGVYNAFILLSIIQLPKSLEGFTKSPTVSAIGIAIGIGMLAYIWYVRGKLFPDFAFITPKKIKGQYVFTS
jgi:hypothetical protein